MPYSPVTPTTLMGSASPKVLAIALNSSAVHFGQNSTSFADMGMVRAVCADKTVRYIIIAEGGYGVGESLTLSLRYMDINGVFRSSESPWVLDSTTVTKAGMVSSPEIKADVPPGTAYKLLRTYVAGGTPNNPGLSIAIHLY